MLAVNEPLFETPAVYKSPMEPPLPPEPEPPAGEPMPEPEPPAEDATPKERAELALVERREDLVGKANALEVTNADTYATASEYAKTLAGWIKEAEAHFDPDIEAANRLHKSLCAKRTDFIGPLKAAFEAMKERAGAWWRKAEAERQAEQRRLEAAAREEADRERQRLLEDAKKAAAAGDVQEAAAIVAESKAIEAAPVTTKRVAPPVRGVAHKENWTYEIKDFPAFVCAVARPHVLADLVADLQEKGAPGEVIAYLKTLQDACPVIPMTALEENGPYLRTRAKADKNTLQWPGARFFDKGSMAVRS